MGVEKNKETVYGFPENRLDLATIELGKAERNNFLVRLLKEQEEEKKNTKS